MLEVFGSIYYSMNSQMKVMTFGNVFSVLHNKNTVKEGKKHTPASSIVYIL